jgi:cobalt-zinc-cadmium efflux system membrane fusion protein
MNTIHLVKLRFFHTYQSGLLALAMLFLFNSCMNEGTNKADGDTEIPVENKITISRKQFVEANMEIGGLCDTTFSRFITSNGYIGVPVSNKVTIGSFMGGNVSAIMVQIGQRVNKGQVLIKIQNAEFIELQRDYLESKAEFLNVKTVYERLKNLAGDNISSQKELQQAEMDYSVTGTRTKALEEKLRLIHIDPNSLDVGEIKSEYSLYAPINGFVSNIYVNPGAWLNAEFPTMDLINTDDLFLHLEVFEKDITKIREGMKVKGSLLDSGSNDLEATIETIGKQIDPLKRTIGVVARINNAEKFQLVYGMFVGAKIMYENYQVVSLPEDAVVDVDNKNYVILIKEESGDVVIAEQIEVKVGETVNGLTEIIQNQEFTKNSKFIIKGGFQLLQ